jgi:putative CocE/NonD family hydrolase
MRDGYDLIEWLAKQAWCNGKIGMAGNSIFAMMQWRVAAEQPPHLACIAPWEGAADPYRELLNWGGFTEAGFNRFIAASMIGKNLVEDCFLMAAPLPQLKTRFKRL